MSQTTTLVLSILAIIVALVSALAAVGSWIAAKRQLEAAERAKKAETLLALFEFLHQNEQRTYRNRLRDPAIAEVDAEAARAVASAFDFAGVFVRHGLVEAPVFLDYWGDQLRFLAQRMSAYLDTPLFGGDTGREYWKDFAWLLAAAEEAGSRLPMDTSASLTRTARDVAAIDVSLRGAGAVTADEI
jgi:hypothetical protein